MKLISFIILLLFSISNFGQNNYKITYLKSSNGTLIENQDAIIVFSNDKQSILTSEKIEANKAEFPFEKTVISNLNYIQVANLKANKTITSKDSTSIGKQNFELLSDTKKILGYTCKKAKTSINSNTIEIWYTNELKVKGAPSVLGQNLGLVLEMNRNGNFLISASKIEKVKKIPTLQIDSSIMMDLLSYKDELWKSRFTTLSLFKDEVINFSNESKSNDSILRYANGTLILKKIQFPKIENGSQVFIDLTEQSNGDAYDRTGSVFLISMDKKQSFLDGIQNGMKTLPLYENENTKQYQGVVATENYTPLLELMRFFTPFGIKQFNGLQLKGKTWEEKAYYRQDISELTASFSNKELYIGTFIGNYDKGGHKVSLTMTVHPEENAKPKPSFVLPIFNTTNVMEMAGQEYGTMFNSEKGLVVNFNLENDKKNVKLRYISTGHGGWENGDEFVPKKNTIFLDNKEVFHFTPWREDCGSYRLYNPASGNFSNGLSSSDYSRSNWCPGMLTNATIIDLGDLKAGNHSIQVVIPQGKNEGTSFSSWNVSGVLIGK